MSFDPMVHVWELAREELRSHYPGLSILGKFLKRARLSTQRGPPVSGQLAIWGWSEPKSTSDVASGEILRRARSHEL
jgi:hypothetical protein